MRDQPYRVDQKRAYAHRHVRVLDRGLARKGLHRDSLVSFVDPIQARDAIDVDQVRRSGQAEIEQGDQ